MTGARAGLVDYLVLFALGTLWGSSFIFTKIAVADIPPATQTAYRLIGGMVVIWALFFVIGGSMPRRLKTHLLVAFSGILGTGLPFYLIAWGQMVVPPGLTAILLAVMPLLTLVFAHFFTTDERFSSKKAAGVSIGFIGTVILVGPALLAGLGSDITRQLAVLLAASCYAANTIVTKAILHVPPIPLVCLSITYGMIPVVVGAFIFDGPFHLAYSFKALSAVAILSVFHTVLATFMLVFLIRRQGATFFSQINLLVPIFGVGWAFLIFGEQPGANDALALLLILTGIAVARGGLQPSQTGT